MIGICSHRTFFILIIGDALQATAYSAAEYKRSELGREKPIDESEDPLRLEKVAAADLPVPIGVVSISAGKQA